MKPNALLTWVTELQTLNLCHSWVFLFTKSQVCHGMLYPKVP